MVILVEGVGKKEIYVRNEWGLVRAVRLGLGPAPTTSVGPPTEFEPPARLGEAPARQAVLKRHAQARAHARDPFRPPPGVHFLVFTLNHLHHRCDR